MKPLITAALWLALCPVVAAQPKPVPHRTPAAASQAKPAVTITEVSFQAASLGRQMKYAVIVPAPVPGRRYAALYLLHGLTGDYTNWEKMTRIADYAQKYQLLVVMPDAGNSWYANSAGNPQDKFEDYIVRDLVRDVDQRYFTLRRRDARAIAGLSMGGYGALKLGLKHAQTFSFAASFSGAQNAERTGLSGGWPKAAVDQFNQIFGPEGSPARVENDLATIIAKADPKTAPYLYLDCGLDDHLLQSNRDTAAQLQKAGFRYEYRERPGGHEWPYWDHQVRGMLEVLAEHMDIGNAK